MYPEDVYTCGLPLPLELLRRIAFQLAYEHIKEKLKFPERNAFHTQRLWYKLIIKNPTDEDMRSIYMIWADHNEYWFNVFHKTYFSGNTINNNRAYKYCKDSGRVSLEFDCDREFDY